MTLTSIHSLQKFKFTLLSLRCVTVEQGSQTRGPSGRFVRPAMLFGNFQIINICVAKCFEKRWSEITDAELNDAQFRFRSGRSTTDQIFTLQQVFVKSWECGKDVYTCFVDLLEKARNRVPREMLCAPQSFPRYGVYSLHSCSDVCVRVGRVKSRPFTVGFGLRQGCVLSPLLFIVYVHWIDSYSRVDKGVTVGSCNINRSAFADDLVLLAVASFQQGLLTFNIHLINFCCVRPSRNEKSAINTGAWCLSRNPR